MKYIFIDESGDLGCKRASSKWFLCAVIITDNERILGHIVKKIWKSLKNKRRGELHATHESDKTRRKLLGMINNLENVQIISVLVDKDSLDNKLNNEYIYNYTLYTIINSLFEELIISKNESVFIYIDKRDTKKSIINNMIATVINPLKVKYKRIISITLQSSHNNKSLQIVDFIAWSIFRKYESKDNTFYNIFKDNIVYEKILKIEKESPLL